MKSLFALLLLTFLVTLMECAVFREVTQVKKGTKEYEEGFRCNSKQYGFMKPSEEISLHEKNVCMAAYCSENGLIVYHSCGAIETGSNSRVIKENLSKPYPDCCPSLAYDK